MNHAVRHQRKRRIRTKVRGTATRPRVSVFRSNTRIAVQLIDDDAGKTLVSTSGKPSEAGQALAQAAKKLGIETVVFDRGGYQYHGRVKAVADSLRDSGLTF